MTRKHRITDVENTLIRQAASKVTGLKRVILEGNIRADDNNESLNIFLLAEDHGLADHMPWADVRKGFELTADGDAKLDIAIYSIDPKYKSREELLTHLAVTWRNKTLVSITSIGRDGDVTLYTKEA